MTDFLSEKEIDTLLSRRTIVFNGEIKWKLTKDYSHFKFKLKQKIDINGKRHYCVLHGTKNCWTNDYTFAILLDSKRIRALCPRKRHRNPESGQMINGLHKHRWSDEYEDITAYAPRDISDVTNMELTLTEFLKECDITFSGTYNNPPPIQLGIPF